MRCLRQLGSCGLPHNVRMPVEYEIPDSRHTSRPHQLNRTRISKVDGVAKYFKPSDYTYMLSPENKEKYDRCQLANTILQRGWLVTAVDPTIPKHRRLHISAALKEACVEAALGRKGSPEQRSSETIAKDFSIEISAALRGEPTTVDSAPSTVDSNSPAQNVITYGVTDPRKRLNPQSSHKGGVR